MGILPSNMIANLFKADAQSLIGIVYFWLALFKARYSNFITDYSFGNEPRFFITFLIELFTDSIALVV
jgi:hypothetical protein